MIDVRKYFNFGSSPTLLYSDMMKSELDHFACLVKMCQLPYINALEMYLPDDPVLRKKEIAIIKNSGMYVNYNTPMAFQVDGEYNSGSDSAEERKTALMHMKQHIEYAAEAECKTLLITGCTDKGPEKRPEIIKRFSEFYFEANRHAKQFGIVTVLEPIERGIFKNLVMGPTDECVELVSSARADGLDNAKIMIDTAHLPLMGEEFDRALELSLKAELGHVHIGDAVMNDPNSKYVGHTHPPLGIHGGVFDVDECVHFFVKLFECGYIRPDGCTGNDISIEMCPYPGVSPETSHQLACEKLFCAFEKALNQVKGEK